MINFDLCIVHVANCDELPPIEHGSVMCNNETALYQEVCRYTCKDGFKLMGKNLTTCLSTGAWSNDEPTCIRGVVKLVINRKVFFIYLWYTISVLPHP